MLPLRRRLLAGQTVVAMRRLASGLSFASGSSQTQTAQQLRASFLAYFEKHGHRVMPSSSLVPQDATLLFTNAGMVQFKDVFVRRTAAPAPCVATVQRCMRAGGKHNDLDAVGHTRRHHTFFEMLGNFSFGDYFRERAIVLAWNYLQKELCLPMERLRFTVLRGDRESERLWKSLGAQQVIECGPEDNFWSMGPTGPCGPCTEIFFDLGEAAGEDRWLEIWNLVLMENEIPAVGATMRELPIKCIDTGMGLERTVAVLQGQSHNYAVDHIAPLVQEALRIVAPSHTGSVATWSADPGPTAARVLADHVRAALALVADGVLPAVTGRGYVLRRIVRRAARYARAQGVAEPCLGRLVPLAAELLGEAYPEMRGAAPLATEIVTREEVFFHQVLTRGWPALEDELSAAQRHHSGVLPGAAAFRLLSARGIPLDVVRDECVRRSIRVDEDGLAAVLAAEQERCRQARGATTATAEHARLVRDAVAMLRGQSVRCAETALATGPESLCADARVLQVCPLGTDGAHGALLVLDPCPFYAQGGGQVGDQGVLHLADGLTAPVLDTVRISPEAVAVVVGGPHVPAVGDLVQAVVDATRRRATAVHHTATHLMQAALRHVLGASVVQAGSLVTPDRLRFDFSHSTALSTAQVAAVEQFLADAVEADLPVACSVESLADAQAAGAIALFGEKYGDRVRMVRVGDRSLELCGGTHVQRTSELVTVRVVGSASVAAGTRRVEAVAGRAALAHYQHALASLQQVAQALGVPVAEARTRAEQLVRRVDELQAQLQTARMRAALRSVGSATFRACPVHVHALDGSEADGGDKSLLKITALSLAEASPGTLQVVLTTGQAGARVGVGAVRCEGAVTARQLLDALCAAFGGRGGGGESFAQAAMAPATRAEQVLSWLQVGSGSPAVTPSAATAMATPSVSS